MSFRKYLNKVPAAACWDYEAIPLSEKLWQTVGITQKSSSLLPRPSLLERGRTGKDCKDAIGRLRDYAEIIVRGNAEIRNPP